MFVKKDMCTVMSGGMRVRDGLEQEDLLSMTVFPVSTVPFFLILVFIMNSQSINVSYIADTESNRLNREAC